MSTKRRTKTQPQPEKHSSTQQITTCKQPTRVLLEHADIRAYYEREYGAKKIHALSLDYHEKDPTTQNNSTSRSVTRTPTIIANPYSAHGLAEAIAQAYNLHQHLRLTPDDIWLAVAQGVSHHIHLHVERFYSYFVLDKGREEMLVKIKDILTEDSEGNLQGDWLECVNRVATESDKEITNLDLKKMLECDFTTSTSVSITASRVVLLNKLQTYYGYRGLSMCGIPKVTLEGTLADWHHLNRKVQRLRSTMLDLDFWLDRLELVVTQLIATYKGEVDEEFWSKVMRSRAYSSGSDYKWSGWVTAFWPYDKRGKKVTGKEEVDPDDIPDGRVNVPFETDTGSFMKLSAGFVGARQEVISEGKKEILTTAAITTTTTTAQTTGEADGEVVISPVIGWLVVDECKPVRKRVVKLDGEDFYYWELNKKQYDRE